MVFLRGKPSPRSRPSRGMNLPRTCSGATPSSGDTPQRPDCKKTGFASKTLELTSFVTKNGYISIEKQRIFYGQFS